MKWNTVLYDKKHNFVSEYGKDLLQYIPNNPKQRILDLGCGTGVLTAQLADLCGNVVGVDSSKDMIEKAAMQYGGIDFKVCDALDLPFEKKFNVVFSNAVFHWISDHDKLIQNIRKSLLPQGCLVCEFGAFGNISKIEAAFVEALKDFGCTYQHRWNFPTVECFEEVLKKNNFEIDVIYDYDRPTALKDGYQGLSNWIKQFFAFELSVIPENEQAEILHNAETKLKPTLWNGEEWTADYRRLRAVAHI